MKFKEGDCVVPLPHEVSSGDSRGSASYSYPQRMTECIGKVGIVQYARTVGKEEVYSVVFLEDRSSWGYYADWLREPTEEEERVFRFLKMIKK